MADRMIEISEEQFFELLDHQDTKKIDHDDWRHGYKARYVFRIDGLSYAAWVNVHPYEGMGQDVNDFPLTAIRVEPVLARVIEWHEVS